jgi:hypothetical protein
VLEVSKQVETLAERMLADAHDLVRCGWCQGTSAVDEMGRAIEPTSAFARRWSAPGALERAWRRMPENGDVVLEAFERANLALAAAVRQIPQEWNDSHERTCDEVLGALARAQDFVRVADGDSPVDDLLDSVGRYDAVPGLLFDGSP